MIIVPIGKTFMPIPTSPHTVTPISYDMVPYPTIFVLGIVLPMLLTCMFGGLGLIVCALNFDKLAEKFINIALTIFGITVIDFAIWAMLPIFFVH